VNFIEGSDRGQTSLLPSCIDDYVAPEVPVRVVIAGLGFPLLRSLATVAVTLSFRTAWA
jgi:hypothetical protein